MGMGLSPVPKVGSVLRNRYAVSPPPSAMLLAGIWTSTLFTVPVSCTFHTRAMRVATLPRPLTAVATLVLPLSSPIASKPKSVAMLAVLMVTGMLDATLLADFNWLSPVLSSRPITMTRF